MRRIVTPIAFLALLPLTAASAEQAYSPKTEVTPLLATSQTIVGQPIAYPAGTAQVTAAIVTVPPGAGAAPSEGGRPDPVAILVASSSCAALVGGRSGRWASSSRRALVPRSRWLLNVLSGISIAAALAA